MSKTEKSPEIPIDLPNGVWLLISMQKDDPVMAIAGKVEEKTMTDWFQIPPEYALIQIGKPRKTPRILVKRCKQIPGLYDVAVPTKTPLATLLKESAEWKDKRKRKNMKEE